VCTFQDTQTLHKRKMANFEVVVCFDVHRKDRICYNTMNELYSFQMRQLSIL